MSTMGIIHVNAEPSTIAAARQALAFARHNGRIVGGESLLKVATVEGDANRLEDLRVCLEQAADDFVSLDHDETIQFNVQRVDSLIQSLTDAVHGFDDMDFLIDSDCEEYAYA